MGLETLIQALEFVEGGRMRKERNISPSLPISASNGPAQTKFENSGALTSVPTLTFKKPTVSIVDSIFGYDNTTTSQQQINAPQTITRTSDTLRKIHNRLEKNRRDKIKTLFGELKEELPSLRDEPKATNLGILRTSIRYIQLLKKKEEDNNEEKEILGARNKMLQKRLKKLKKEKEDEMNTLREEDVPDYMELIEIESSDSTVSSMSDTDTQ